jgi:predicted GNAT family acetyltransferase
MTVTVYDDPDRSRFVIDVDDAPAGFAAYRVRDGAVVITHTEIDKAHRGEGLGGQLAAHTLDTLRGRGARVIPSCPFFAGYIADHPEYADLVDL